MIIYVDADACPVRDSIISIAIRHEVSVVMVCNGGIRPYPHPLITLRVVPSGPDEADKWIADMITEHDILITSDIPLAARAVEKNAIVIRPDGSSLTKDNIGNTLAMRDLMADIRAADPFHQSKSKPFSASDKAQFNQTLDQALIRMGT
jgi:uncharacterized protein YaiI (UPF0178 family)